MTVSTDNYSDRCIYADSSGSSAYSGQTSSPKTSRGSRLRGGGAHGLLQVLIEQKLVDASGRLLDLSHQWPEFSDKQLEILKQFYEAQTALIDGDGKEVFSISLAELDGNMRALLKDKGVLLGALRLAGSRAREFFFHPDYLIACFKAMGVADPVQAMACLKDNSEAALDIDLRYRVCYMGGRPKNVGKELQKVGRAVVSSLAKLSAKLEKPLSEKEVVDRLINKGQANKPIIIRKEAKSFLMRGFHPFELLLIHHIGRSFQFPSDNLGIRFHSDKFEAFSAPAKGLSPLQAWLDCLRRVVRIHEPGTMDDFAWPKLMCLIARDWQPVGEDLEGALLDITAQVAGRPTDRLLHAFRNHCPHRDVAMTAAFQAVLSMADRGIFTNATPRSEWSVLNLAIANMKAFQDQSPGLLMEGWQELMKAGDVSFEQGVALMELLAYCNLNGPEGRVRVSSYFGKPSLRIQLGKHHAVQLPYDVKRCLTILSQGVQLSPKSLHALMTMRQALRPEKPYRELGSSPLAELDLSSEAVRFLSHVFAGSAPDLAMDLHQVAVSLNDHPFQPPLELLDCALAGHRWAEWTEILAPWLPLKAGDSHEALLEAAASSKAPAFRAWAVSAMQRRGLGECTAALERLSASDPLRLINLISSEKNQTELDLPFLKELIYRLSTGGAELQLALDALWDRLSPTLYRQLLWSFTKEQPELALRMLRQSDWRKRLYSQEQMRTLFWLLARDSAPEQLLQQLVASAFSQPQAAAFALRDHRKQFARLLPLLDQPEQLQLEKAVVKALAEYYDRYCPDKPYPKMLREVWVKHFPRPEQRPIRKRVLRLFAEFDSERPSLPLLRDILRKLQKHLPEDLRLWQRLITLGIETADPAFARELLDGVLSTVPASALPERYPAVLADRIHTLLSASDKPGPVFLQQFLHGSPLMAASFAGQAANDFNKQVFKKLGKGLFSLDYDLTHVTERLAALPWKFVFQLLLRCPDDRVDANRDLLNAAYRRIFPSLQRCFESFPCPLPADQLACLQKLLPRLTSPQNVFVKRLLQRDALLKRKWQQLDPATLTAPQLLLGSDPEAARSLIAPLTQAIASSAEPQPLVGLCFRLVQQYDQAELRTWQSFKQLLAATHIPLLSSLSAEHLNPTENREMLLRFCRHLIPQHAQHALMILVATGLSEHLNLKERCELILRCKKSDRGLVDELTGDDFASEAACRNSIRQLNWNFERYFKLLKRLDTPQQSWLLFCLIDMGYRGEWKKLDQELLTDAAWMLKSTENAELMQRSLRDALGGFGGRYEKEPSVEICCSLIRAYSWDAEPEFEHLIEIALNSNSASAASCVLCSLYFRDMVQGVEVQHPTTRYLRWRALLGQCKMQLPHLVLLDFLNNGTVFGRLFEKGANRDLWALFVEAAAAAVIRDASHGPALMARYREGIESLENSSKRRHLRTEMISCLAKSPYEDCLNFAVGCLLEFFPDAEVDDQGLKVLRILGIHLRDLTEGKGETYLKLCQRISLMAEHPAYKSSQIFPLLETLIYLKGKDKALLLGKALMTTIKSLPSDERERQRECILSRNSAEVVFENLMDRDSQACRIRVMEAWALLHPKGAHGTHLLGPRLESNFHFLVLDDAIGAGDRKEIETLLSDYFEYKLQLSFYGGSCRQCRDPWDFRLLNPMFLAFRYLERTPPSRDASERYASMEAQLLKMEKLPSGWYARPDITLDAAARLLDSGIHSDLVPWAEECCINILRKLKPQPTTTVAKQARGVFDTLLEFHYSYSTSIYFYGRLRTTLHELVLNGYYQGEDHLERKHLSMLHTSRDRGRLNFEQKLKASTEGFQLMWSCDSEYAVRMARDLVCRSAYQLRIETANERSSALRRKARQALAAWLPKMVTILLAGHSRLQSPSDHIVHLSRLREGLFDLIKVFSDAPERRCLASIHLKVLRVLIKLGRLDKTDPGLSVEDLDRALDTADLMVDTLRNQQCFRGCYKASTLAQLEAAFRPHWTKRKTTIMSRRAGSSSSSMMRADTVDDMMSLLHTPIPLPDDF